MRFSRTLLISAIVVVVAGAIAGGCRSTTTTPAQALEPALAGNDAGAQLDFWHALPERKAVSNDEAFHGLLLFVGGEDAAKDYDSRVRALKEKKMLADGFNEPAASAVRRGTLAVALAKALDIKGGLSMRLFGAHDRYAVRELQYAGLFPPSSPQQTFSGQEFLGIIGRAEDYQRIKSGEDVETPAMDEQEPPTAASAAAGDGGV